MFFENKRFSLSFFFFLETNQLNSRFNYEIDYEQSLFFSSSVEQNARDTEMTTRVTEDALTKSEEKETARSLAMQPLKTFKTFTLLSRAFRNLSSRTFLIKSSV